MSTSPPRSRSPNMEKDGNEPLREEKSADEIVQMTIDEFYRKAKQIMKPAPKKSGDDKSS